MDTRPADPAHHRRWRFGLLLHTGSPAGTPIETLVKVEGHRWAIEDSFETAKNELGFDHNETRSWHGWHRHVSLVMLAFAMLAIIRYRTNIATPQKTNPRKILRQSRHAP
jgi:SRSO17 transposase